ncbi:MAG: S8 family serine peptidase [Verrucomicrobiota bacterium]
MAFGADGRAAAPRKVRVQDRAQAQQLIERGGQLVADYGSFQIILTEESAVATKLQGRVQADAAADFIELNARRIDTRSPETRALRKTRSVGAGRQFHLVQFVGPVKPEWRTALEGQGVKVINYIPENAYLVSGDAKALAALQTWAVTVPFVQWEGEYTPDFKVHPAARQRELFGLAAPANESDVFAIQIVEDTETTPATLALIESLKLDAVQRDFRVLQYRNIIVRLPTARLGDISACLDVLSIQPYNEPDKRDERQAQILAGNLMGGSLTGPGYLDWLTEKGFTQAQFDASGFVVDVTDSGIDNGTSLPGHFGLYAHADFGQASRVAYNRLVGTAHAGSTLAGLDGHGNLNAHILAGFSDFTGGFPHVDSSGYQSGLGVCPFVRVGSSVVFDPDFFTSPDYTDLQSRAYQDGARISANSWGATNNAYTVDAQAFDALVRDAQPAGAAFAAPGNQEMVILFAAGNRGTTANTVGAPGTAKNVITVGAAENVQLTEHCERRQEFPWQ